jgi:hypothetical protein
MTQLVLQAAQGERRATPEFDIGVQDLVGLAEKHELRVLDQFQTRGHEVADLTHAEDPVSDEGGPPTGPGVIYQATLTAEGGHPRWVAWLPGPCRRAAGPG